MAFNKEHARQLLKNFSFKDLFVEDLGWDHYKARPVSLHIDNENYSLNGLVEKRGMTVFECSPDSSGNIPPSPIRRKIENQIRKTAVEHIIIYTDSAKTHQKWQWIRRKTGRPIASREHDFTKSQAGEALLQKISHLEIPVDEEGDLTIFGVTTRAQAAFDVDKVTKKFYERFKQEHAVFLKFIKGIVSQADREWYASLMLNRLMFCYFIQRKGFLDNDTDYLRNRMNFLQDKKGKDKFFSFYRHFLLRLFHEGLGKREHSKDLDSLIGKVPYLNGGFFDIHKLENNNPEIDIPDKAFEKVFDFFDDYHWHLDERPLRNDKEINPDVLGYIFEKYINQKQMGAYYTKEDITGYISKNTIIPWLFDTTKKKCEIAFQPNSSLWRLLKEDPDLYIYPAMRKGVIAGKEDIESGIAKNVGEIIPLPKEIEAGVKDVSKRGNWNTPCDEKYALPTEIWREHVARRQRCLEIRQKLQNGEIHQINDLITYNLDITQFAEDVITKSEGPELLRANYDAITSISVLDPTCGSGAFLFAALNILEELYDACINRMEIFIDDADRAEPGNKKYKDFRQTLEQMAKHPSRQYFIYKSIIINNLFGVDIMEEAVEICKLRLFLKLVAQVENADQIEPLPDIDFSIRAGNTLVGFATYEELKKSQEGELDLYGDFAKLDEQAELVSMAYKRYKEGQLTDTGTEDLQKSKHDLETRLEHLNDRLNEYLAHQYGLDKFEDIGGNDGLFQKDSTLKQTTKKYEKWLVSHQPFHWFSEFYQIMHKGGFDVVIGNPPYVELDALDGYRALGYEAENAGNLYALVLERSEYLTTSNSRLGFIVPVSSVSTDRYQPLQSILTKHWLCYSSFDDRPSRLFEGLEHIRLTIHILGPKAGCGLLFASKYNKWNASERLHLFNKLQLCTSASSLVVGSLPKLSDSVELSIISKLARQKQLLQMSYTKINSKVIYYSRKVGYFLQVLDFIPEVRDGKGKLRPPSEFKDLCFSSKEASLCALACLNSNLFYWFVTVFSDCRHVNKREVDSFPICLDILIESETGKELRDVVRKLMKSLKDTSENRIMSFKHDTITVQCILPKPSKPLIDQIDTLLAKHYGFTDEELDYIINYDIKYRMGGELEATEDDE
jgi:Eco57I restriction endonuclease.